MSLQSFQRRFRTALDAEKVEPVLIDWKKTPRGTQRHLRFKKPGKRSLLCPITLVCWHEKNEFYPVEDYCNAAIALKLDPQAAWDILFVADDWIYPPKHRTRKALALT